MPRYRFGKKIPSVERARDFIVYFVAWNIVGYGLYKLFVHYGPGGKKSSDPSLEENRSDADVFKDVLGNLVIGDKPVKQYTVKGFSGVVYKEFSDASEMNFAAREEREKARKEKEAQEMNAKDKDIEITLR